METVRIKWLTRQPGVKWNGRNVLLKCNDGIQIAKISNGGFDYGHGWRGCLTVLGWCFYEEVNKQPPEAS